jgi:subtilase family serine protease
LRLKVDDKKEELKLAYTVKNFLIAPDKGLPVTLVLPLE